MKDILKWLVPVTLTIFVLSVPMVAGAVLTPPSLSSYLVTVNDGIDLSNAENAYDIINASQGYFNNDYYFLVEMKVGITSNNYATDYKLYVGSKTFNANLTWVGPGGNTPQWLLTPTPGDFGSTATGGKLLEWKLTAADLSGIGPNPEWWVETYSGLDLKDTTAHSSVVPIPNSAWLLGSGIIGLIGLKRRRARKA